VPRPDEAPAVSDARVAADRRASVRRGAAGGVGLLRGQQRRDAGSGGGPACADANEAGPAADAAGDSSAFAADRRGPGRAGAAAARRGGAARRAERPASGVRPVRPLPAVHPPRADGGRDSPIPVTGLTGAADLPHSLGAGMMEVMSRLSYHQSVFDLLDLDLVESPAAVEI